ncbi:MAG: hypothetical protein CMJ88_09660 [Planctomycetes bacterium]|nr:hypothetical protein [Planctomycetota bacterium]
MQRSLTITLLFLIVVAAVGSWWLLGDAAAPPSLAPNVAAGSGRAAETQVVAAEAALPPRGDVVAREAVATRGNPLLDDPDIRAGLCGFRGRVVDFRKAPVPQTGVRIYRGAMDSVLNIQADLFADPADFTPQLVAGEALTGDDGRFEITGVWPRGFYLMFAGMNTDAPTHQVLAKAPSPGEIVDLGDVVLNNAGVITGVVYDAEGEPLPDALIRAADIPGALARFFPAERFDPEGALLIREPRAPVSVLPMPPWVKRVFDDFPIPTTRSAADGSFRLVGVIPGSNMFAVTARDHLSFVRDSVIVRAGQEKNIGRVGMRLGEELYAKVVDTKGDPIAGAEVAAGSTLSLVPVDLAQLLGETNAAGEIDGTGFAPGKVTVAARRSPKHAWVLADPQSINGDVVVTLPAMFSATISVQLADGSPAEKVRFRLLRGRKGDGAAEMYLMGFAPPVPLEERLKRVDEGQWTVSDLHAGTYTLLADVEGQATGSAVFEIVEEDVAASVKLKAPNLFAVRVVDQEQQPIRNVAIYAEPRGDRIVEVPVNCGRTNEDGRVTIDKIRATSLRVSADHPLWGVVHGEAKEQQELLLTMIQPGALRGVLSENGKPPLPGKFSVAIVRGGGGGPRGPLEGVPQLVTAGLDGTFVVRNLQPGRYWVAAVSSLDTLRSPGATFEIAQSMFIDAKMPSERVEIVSGQDAEVRLEVGDKPLDGPTARLTGSVTINGRAAEGYTIVARLNKRRFAGEVDERGRFDLGVVSAGKGSVAVMGSEGGMFMGPGQAMWSQTLELAEGEPRELTVDINTSSISGVVYLPDGRPAAKMYVQARAQLGARGDDGRVRKFVGTNDDGTFVFRDVAEASYTIRVRGGDDDQAFEAELKDLEVKATLPITGLVVQLKAKLMATGTVDMSGIPDKGRWRYMTLQRIGDPAPGDPDDGKVGFGVDKDGSFSTDDVQPGQYEAELIVGRRGRERTTYACGIINVGVDGAKDVKLTARVK